MRCFYSNQLHMHSRDEIVLFMNDSIVAALKLNHAICQIFVRLVAYNLFVQNQAVHVAQLNPYFHYQSQPP